MAKEKKPQRSGTVRLDEQYASAKQLYVDHGKEAKDIANVVGVGYRTVLNWIKGKEGDPNRPDWQKLRAAQTMSKSDQLRDLAGQIQQLNAKIKARDEGHRHATSMEADIINKLTKAYNYLETDLGVREIVDVMTEFIPFIKKYSSDDADTLKAYADKFIQQTIAKAR
jgi:transposase